MESSTFDHDGARLHITAHGHGPDVVLIHGLSGSGRWWRHNLPALTRAHRVHVLDLAGFGAARRQRSTGVRAAARAVVAWLHARPGAGPVTLVGHSMGGHISLHVAALAPDLVTRLVLACPSGLSGGPLHRPLLALPRALVVGRKRFVPQILGDAVRAGPRNLLRSSRDLLRDSVQDVLPAVTMPTLVVWGARDVLVPVQAGEQLAAALPDARLVVLPGAGHVVMVDAAATFNALVLDFMTPAALVGRP